MINIDLKAGIFFQRLFNIFYVHLMLIHIQKIL